MNKNEKIELVENNDLFVVADKPEGLSVHNSNESSDKTDLLLLLKEQLKIPLFPVHRIDKETSGLIILAKKPEYVKNIIFKNEFSKKYVTILRGQITQSEGQWNFAISDKAEGRNNPQGLSADRKASCTNYKVIAQNKYFSMLECEILTGRQHQIRKHAAIAQHAVLGDSRYGDKKYNEKIASIYGETRMFLHAMHLGFVVSAGGQNKCFKFQSKLPETFKRFI
jgi:tRNA pseudouridine65 synthase